MPGFLMFVSLQDVLMASKAGGCVKNQISVHNAVHPYRFTKDMLAGMKVLRQLDDKFIVGVLSQEGKIHRDLAKAGCLGIWGGAKAFFGFEIN